jgi:plastocyanin
MRFAALLACAAAAILLLGACGDDDSSDATADTGGVTETTAATGSGEEACAAPTSDFFGPQTGIAEGWFAFNPDTVTVASGDVFWVENEDGTTHTVTSDEGGFDCEMPGGEGASIRLDAAPGHYEFHCRIHPSITGTLTVVQ